MHIFEKYLIVINLIAFIIYLINIKLYSNFINKFLRLLSLIGGSIGILFAIVLFDRKSTKENMMTRVFTISVFIIEVIIFLIFKGYMKKNITFALWEPFIKNKILLIYFLIINFITFILFLIDKRNSVDNKKSRIKIVTLLLLSFIGGSIGGLLGIYLLHHKTKKDYFTLGIKLIILMQIIVLFYLLNIKL